MKLKSLYGRCGGTFEPRIMTFDDFIGISVCDEVIEKAIEGTALFRARYDNGILFPKQFCNFKDAELDLEPEIHNYTGQCPVQTYEINPVEGCNVGCAYCLVNDGIHPEPVVHGNYAEIVSGWLTRYRHSEHFFYFSPKTEAFCEATLQTGVAHNILRAFVRHYAEYPDSLVRLFVASKAGVQALMFTHDGESVLDLFKQLRGKMQFNTSLSIFPGEAVYQIEPYSATLDDRLEAVRLCQENGIIANSALVQPILFSVLTDELLNMFFARIRKYGIINIKPEFLTACVENMVMMAQLLEGHTPCRTSEQSPEATTRPNILKEIFESYFQDDNLNHIKQRGRTAPARRLSKYWIDKIIAIAKKYGVSVSICYWVREQLGITPEDLPIINENGFKCLGYQTNLFAGA